MRRTVLVLLFAAAGAACHTAEQTPKAAEPQVVDARLTQARIGPVTQSFEAGGVVAARLTAPVSSRLMAPVVDVLVRPGDRVTAGRRLIVLDGRDLQAQAERATTSVTAAEQAIRAATSEREAAAAALTLATAGHGRIAGLHASKAATDQELDEAVASLRAAEARASGAEARVAEATAGLAAAKASATGAAITASYATIDAPFAGTITERKIDPGMMAAPGVPLLTIEDVSSARLEVRLDAERASSISAGQAVSVRCDDRIEAWTDARVAEVSRIDASGHGFLVKIDCPAAEGLQSGRFGRVRVPTGSRQALTVPESALVRRGQLTFVFAVDGSGAARLRPVTAGPVAEGRVDIAAGLAEGEQIVDAPATGLVDGTRIRGAASSQPPSSPAAGGAR